MGYRWAGQSRKADQAQPEKGQSANFTGHGQGNRKSPTATAGRKACYISGHHDAGLSPGIVPKVSDKQKQ